MRFRFGVEDSLLPATRMTRVPEWGHVKLEEFG